MKESVNPYMAETSSVTDNTPEVPVASGENPPILAANSRSFHIDFYDRQDYYRGRIALLGSNRKKILKGVDVAAIAEFICQNLPLLPRKSPDAAFFEEIRLLQRGRRVVRDQPLKAWKHFCIHVRWNLPYSQAADAVDESEKAYAVQALILDEKQEHIVASNAEGSTLQPGVSSYTISIAMDGLQPARYFTKIQVVSPFSGIKESTRIDLHVEP